MTTEPHFDDPIYDPIVAAYTEDPEKGRALAAATPGTLTYASSHREAARDEADTEDAALAAWLAEQTWSSFATSLADQHKAGRRFSAKQRQAARAMKAKVDAKTAARQEEKAADTGIDLSPIPSGTYAVPGGDTRLKVRINHVEKGKWAGYTFVDDGAEYGQRKNYGRQEPGGTYRGDIQEALTAILADPAGAAAAYGRLTGRCAICGRALEDEDSVARGIGPICAGKF
jgi:hypothetical protein